MLRTHLKPITVCFGCLLLIVGWASAVGQDDAETGQVTDDLLSEKIERFAKQLGSADYAQREQATEQLFGIGLPALAKVETLLNDDDPEVRYRAANLFQLLKPLRLQQRLAQFLQNEEPPDAAPLAGWQRFSQQFGADEKSRALFAEMYFYGRHRLTQFDAGKVFLPPKQEPGEPRTDEGDEDALDHPELGRRRTKLNLILEPNKTKNSLPLGWIAVRVFLAGEPAAAQHAVLQKEAVAACFEPAWWEAIESEAHGELVRRLTARLISTNAKERPIILALAARFGLREALPVAIEILAKPTAKQRYWALFPVAAFGDASQLSLVKPWLQDESVVYTSPRGDREIQQRDAALATVLLLSKEPVRNYFPERKKPLPLDASELLASPQSIGFAGADEREITFEQWWKKHPEEMPTEREGVRVKQKQKQKQ